MDTIYNFCFAGGGRDTPAHTCPAEMTSAEWEQHLALLTEIAEWLRCGVGMVGGGIEHQAGSFQNCFFSESLDDPVFPNMSLKMIFFFSSHKAHLEVEGHLWAICWSEKKIII